MFTPTLQGAIDRACKLEALRQHITGDSALSKRAGILALALLDEGRLSSKSTNAELCQRLDYRERSLQYGFRELEARHYGNRKAGANTARYDTFLPPLWTWYHDIACEKLNLMHPVITIESSWYTDVAIVDRLTGEIMQDHTFVSAPQSSSGTTFWQDLYQKLDSMSDAEIGQMRYNAIHMRRVEERRGSGRDAFWRIQENIFAGVLADKGILQPANVLLRVRTEPIR